MGITTCRLEGPVDFYSVGQFVSGPGWRHLRRTIDTFELMFVRRGVLPMRVGEQTLHIEAGQIALLPPNVEHAGADIITSDVDFYWMHFKLPDARMLPDDAGLPQDDHCLLLPDERTLPDPDRLAVMCGQLIDIYARFGPYSNAYCDYFATGLLLEVSAQERLKADFAAHRTLAGYRGDGKPITSADRVRQQQEWAMHVDSAGAAGDSSGLAPMLAIRSWIMANAFDDITVAKVAARFHYSPSYLTAMYRRVFGVGVAEQTDRISHRPCARTAEFYRFQRGGYCARSGLRRSQVLHARLQAPHWPDPRPIPRRFPRPPLQHRVIREGHGPNPRKSAHGRHYHVGALGTV